MTPSTLPALAAASSPSSTQVAVVVADVQGSVLVRSFLIAVVVMAPVWVLVRKRVTRSHATDDSGEVEPDADAAPRLEDVIAEVSRLAPEVRATGSATLTVPADVTVDGRAVDSGTVDALVRDSLRRSGLVAAAEIDTPQGRTLELRPLGPGPDADPDRTRT